MTPRADAAPRGPIPVTTLVDSLVSGGAERVAVELACALDRSRFAPHVIVTRDDGPLRSLLDDADVPCTMLGRRGMLDLRPWLRAHRQLRGAHGGILHAHKFGSNAWGALLARAAGVPLVVHEHNFSATPSRLRSVIDRRWISTRAARVLCVSESVAAVERSNGVPESLIEVVDNGVRLDAAWSRTDARAALGLADGPFTIGIVGRLRPEKAHEVLIESVSRLVAAGRDVQLCIVGDGPRRAELAALVTRFGLDAMVTWAGERSDAATLAAAFDAAVICSHWEGLPLAALEAMAAGVPLVASNVGGLPSLLAGRAGLLVPPADPPALQDALASLIDDPSERDRIGAAGRERIASAYSFAGMVERIESIYEDIAERHRARSDRDGRTTSSDDDTEREAA